MQIVHLTPDTPLLEYGRGAYLTAAHHHSGKLPTQQLGVKVTLLCGELAGILGRIPVVADLTSEVCGRLTERLAVDYSPKTISFMVGLFKAIARYASEQGLIELPDELAPAVATLDLHVPSGKSDTLLYQAEQMFAKKLEIQSPLTVKGYRLAIGHFGRHLGREPVLSDLTDDAITIWTKEQLAARQSVLTVRERMGRILSLWNWLAKRRLVHQFPTVQRPPAPENRPIAMTEDQIRQMFASAMWEPRKIGGILAGHFWQAFFAFIWSTAERCEAAMKVRWEWIDFERRLCIIPGSARKGRTKTAYYTLWPEVIPLLQRIRQPERELVFPWPYSMGKYYHNFGRIMVRAGLPDDGKHKTHCLRVSHATWLKALGGDPTRARMHSSPETTQKHYIDRKMLPVEERKLFVPWQPAVDEAIASESFI